MMKTTLFTLLLLTLFVFSASAQEKIKFGDAIGAKVLFLDHGQPNSIDSLNLTNGLEVSYIRGINQFLTLAVPLKVSVAEFADDTQNNRNIASLDGVLQFQYYKPESRIIPYALLGGGVVLEQERDAYWQVPVGAGVNLRVGRNSFINVQGEYRYTSVDYRKGLQLGVGYIYRFEKMDIDRDKDGIKNDEDACPDSPGPIETMGCPDRDSDGVPDQLDACPDMPGPVEKQGCPDTDGDGLVDNKDACPEEAGPEETMGCPDKDGDGTPDKDDNCPDKAGNLQGCPDMDSDGVADDEDDCPEEAGPADNNGCPKDMESNENTNFDTGENTASDAPDSDRDGTPDDQDMCPDEFGPALTKGCPDTDGDGVADKDDRCPNQPGPYTGCPDTDGDGIMDADDRCPDQPGMITNGGCPELEREVQEVLDFAMRAVQFETGKATLKAVSYDVLDQIAAIMERYPGYKLRISGHTDNVGARSNNQILSEERAESCYEYLISAGVDPARITHTGYGESRPIASNNTAEGKSLNRRVEFELYVE